MAGEADPMGGAPAAIVKAAHEFGLWEAVGAAALLIVLVRSPAIIKAIGDVVKGWRETSLAIRQFEAQRGQRVNAIEDDVRRERERLDIRDGA